MCHSAGAQEALAAVLVCGASAAPGAAAMGVGETGRWAVQAVIS